MRFAAENPGTNDVTLVCDETIVFSKQHYRFFQMTHKSDSTATPAFKIGQASVPTIA
jgi:hypothetical protein